MSITGQVWYLTQGGDGDTRLVSINDDGSQNSIVIDNSGVDKFVSSFPLQVAVDTAAGKYFIIQNDPAHPTTYGLYEGSIDSTAGPVLKYTFGADDIINAVEIDPVTQRLYVGVQEATGGIPSASGIQQFTYDPLTGTVTNNGLIVTLAQAGLPVESGSGGSFNILDPYDLALDTSTNSLFYTQNLTGTVSSEGLYRVNLTTHAVTQVVAQSQFPDDGSNGYIIGVVVDASKDLLYFSTESQHPSPDAGYNAGLNKIYYIDQNATNGTATALSVTGLPSFFYPGMMTFDTVNRRIYVTSEQTDLNPDTDEVIYVLQLDTAGTSASVIGTIDPANFVSAGNFGNIIFNALPDLVVSGTNSMNTGAAAAALLTGAPTLTDADGDHLAGASVKVSGSFLASGDALGYGAGLQTSGTISGTNITVSVTTDGSGNKTLTLTGYDTIAHYQAVMASIEFSTGNSGTNGGSNATRTITWHVDDGAYGDPAGDNTQTTILNLTTITDPTLVATGATPTLTEGGSAVDLFSGVTAQTNDVGETFTGAAFTVTNVANGASETLTIDGTSLSLTDANSGTIAGLGAYTISVAAGTATITLTGMTLTNAEMGALIDNITYGNSSEDPAGSTRAVTITHLTDSGGKSVTPGAQATVSIVAVNDAPVNSVPDAQALNQDGALTFNTANGNLLSVSDVDAGSASEQVTLTATHGQITLSGTSGLSFVVGSGSGDNTMTFTGSITDINAALNGMVYTPTSGYNGSASIQITTSDQGNAGTGGTKTDTDTIGLTIAGLSPTISDISTTAADGTYGIGDQITVTMTFDQAVSVTGNPTLLLETGATDRNATYVSGSGSNELTFTYTVQAGDQSSDLDFTSTAALTLNGGTIKSSGGDDVDLTLPTTGGSHSIAGQHDIVIDGIVPTVESVDVPANGIYVQGDKLTFTLNLSDDVTVDTAHGKPRILVSFDGGAKAYASYVGGSGTDALTFRMTVKDSQRDVNGIVLGTTINMHGGEIKDAAGNDLDTALTHIGSTKNVLIENNLPTLEVTQLVSSIAENASTVKGHRIADLHIADVDGGNNQLSLSGADASLFEIRKGDLWLKAGAMLDYETNPKLNVTVSLDDPTIGSGREDFHAIAVTIQNKPEGTGGDNTLIGGKGDDALSGKGGDDVLKGGAGDDQLIGGTGADTMIGGTGRDTFVFQSIKDSAPGESKHDIILDFVHGQDLLDVSAIDANTTKSGDQAFVWRGTGGFTGALGELFYRNFDHAGTAKDVTIVYGDTNHDGNADFQIELTGLIHLTKGDFLL